MAVDVTPVDKLRELEFNQQELVKKGSYLSLAQTATNSQIQIMSGFLLLVLSCAIWLWEGRVEKLKVSNNL